MAVSVKFFFACFLTINFFPFLLGNSTSQEASFTSRSSISAATSWNKYKGTSSDETTQAAVVIGVICLGCFSGFLALFYIINSLRKDKHTTARLYDCVEYESSESVEKHDIIHLKPTTNDTMDKLQEQFKSTSV